MKHKHDLNSLSNLVALAAVLALVLGLSACSGTQSTKQVEAQSSQAADSAFQVEEAVASAPQSQETESSALVQVAAQNEATQLTSQGGYDDEISLLDEEDHQFEQEIAYRYYHNGDSQSELSDSERNQMLSDSVWGFDDKGHGVFAVQLDASMNQSVYFIEYTTDYGETWTGAGTYNLVTWIEDIKVSGDRVVLSVGNNVNESKHSLVYSDDMCQSFKERDTIDFAPHHLTAVIQGEDAQLGMDVLSIDKTDGSVVLGWYEDRFINVSEYKDFDDKAQSSRDYFLIGKTDVDFTQLQELYVTEAE